MNNGQNATHNEAITYYSTEMAICSVCGKLNPPGSRNCDLCGAPIAGAELSNGQHIPRPGGHPELQPPEAFSGPICPVCGRPNRSISVFCAFCGYRLKGNGAQPYALPNVNNGQGSGPTPPASDEAGNIPSGTLLKKRYRIMRKIAQGGMGAVYEATDTTAPTGTRWAVKEMSPAALPAGERTQAIADFRREAQMLASLHHPNLPQVVETFEELGKNFLVMEFVAGRTLQNVLDGTPGFLLEERVCVWARQLTDVISYLHSQNPTIIYRDLKPSNIMLIDSSELIKLIDFGIARFHKAGKAQDTEAFGTAGYAPPEQYGKGQTDQRSDIYALGATLHYLVTKHDPGLNPFNWLPVRQYNAAISSQFETAIQVALNLDPQRRFASMADFATAMGLNIPGTAQGYNQHQQAPANGQGKAAPVPVAPATPRNQSQRQRNPAPRPSANQPRTKQQPPVSAPIMFVPPAAPVSAAPPNVPVPAVQAPSTPVTPAAATAVQDPPTMSKPSAVETAPEVDRGTASTSAPSPTHNGQAPALVVSDYVLNLGEARWNREPVGKVNLLNVGGGNLEGAIVSTAEWLVPSIHKFKSNTKGIEVRVRKAALPFGRVDLQVPNLFAIIWTRAKWVLPFIGFWLWLLLLVASSVDELLLLGLAVVVIALIVSEALMWLWALHARLLVPAEKLNTGRLVVKSSGGEQQIEVRVKARPSQLRIATGWAMVATLMSAELGSVAWLVYALFF